MSQKAVYKNLLRGDLESPSYSSPGRGFAFKRQPLQWIGFQIKAVWRAKPLNPTGICFVASFNEGHRLQS